MADSMDVDYDEEARLYYWLISLPTAIKLDLEETYYTEISNKRDSDV